MFAKVHVLAKPGELMQGMLPDNTSFLLSNKSSTVFKTTVKITDAIPHQGLKLKEKSTMAADLFFSKLPEYKKSLHWSDLHIEQQSNIPIGKGLSSSSADVLSILQALNIFYDAGSSVNHLYELASIVEPTDPCLHEENLIFNQNNGRIIHALPPLDYSLIYFNTENGITIDTQDFHSNIKYSSIQKKTLEYNLREAMNAFKLGNYTLLFQSLRASALVSEEFLPKNKFELLLDFSMEKNCGIFVAHTGTYMGLVVKPTQLDVLRDEATEFINTHWSTQIHFEK